VQQVKSRCHQLNLGQFPAMQSAKTLTLNSKTNHISLIAAEFTPPSASSIVLAPGSNAPSYLRDGLTDDVPAVLSLMMVGC